MSTQSLFPSFPEDPKVVRLSDGEFGAKADGSADDAPALQRAIDAVQERYGSGIVAIPSGTYRLEQTVHLWRGIRLIGFGQTRPVFLLRQKTPGFAGPESKYMVHFCDARPRAGQPLKDACNVTFWSGIWNINFRIEKGNAGAVACRYFVAQLCALSYIDFDIGDGKAAIEQAGNQIDNCRFSGGKFGIITDRTSAGWQVLVSDCVFENQRESAICSTGSGMTVIRCDFRNMPRAFAPLDQKPEQIYLADCRLFDLSPDFEKIDGNQINLHRVRAGKSDLDRPASADIPALPPVDQWINVKRFGAVGDGQTDDTSALRKAIESHRVVYLPMGKYRITDTIALKPDTCLIGLHCEKTRLVLSSNSDGFGDEDAPRPMLLTPRDGKNIVRGIGFTPGHNPGAVVIKWEAGKDSFLDDIWIDWSAGRAVPRGKGVHQSLWITGGGTFRNIWSANINSKTGLLITDSSTPGRVYLTSVEHHLEREVELRNVANWHFIALQTEENLGSEKATAIVMDNCRDLEFANLVMYRVIALTQPHPHGARISNSRNIVFRGIHTFSWGKLPFENSIYDADTDTKVPCEAAYVVLGGK